MSRKNGKHKGKRKPYNILHSERNFSHSARDSDGNRRIDERIVKITDSLVFYAKNLALLLYANDSSDVSIYKFNQYFPPSAEGSFVVFDRDNVFRGMRKNYPYFVVACNQKSHRQDHNTVCFCDENGDEYCVNMRALKHGHWLKPVNDSLKSRICNPVLARILPSSDIIVRSCGIDLLVKKFMDEAESLLMGIEAQNAPNYPEHVSAAREYRVSRAI